MSLTISLTPEQVEQRLTKLGIPCRFTSEERNRYNTIPVVNRDGHLRFPTPADNTALTLRNIKSIVGTDPSRQPCFFDHPWYLDEQFMAVSCPSGWHNIGMDVIPGSINQPFNYADRLSMEHAELPTAIEVVLMLFLHYVGSGEQLMLRKHTWCLDVASLGRHVTVGAFGRNGVFISSHPPGFASRGLGICPIVRDTNDDWLKNPQS